MSSSGLSTGTFVDSNGVWGKILAVTAGVLALIGGPGVIVINDLRNAVKEQLTRQAELERAQVADHSYQAVAAVQQWCDAVIRELERESENHSAYYRQQCPAAIPPVSIYHPPAPPWGPSTIAR